MVDLVGDDGQGEVGQLLQPGGGEDGSGGIGRRVDQQSPGPVGDELFDLLGAGLKAIFGAGAQKVGNASGEADEVGVAGIAGIGQNDLVPVLEQSREEQQHQGAGSRGDEDLLRRDLDAVSPQIEAGDLPAQVQPSQGMSVEGFTALQSAGRRVGDSLGGGKIGLAEAEVNDVAPFLLQGLGPLHDFHGEKGGDVDGAAGHPGCRFGHGATS